MKYALMVLVVFLAAGMSVPVAAQVFDGNDPFAQDTFGVPPGQTIGDNPFAEGEEGAEGEEAEADTLKRERKPLESYFFDDETRAQDNFMWNISMSENRIQMREIDTLLYDFQILYPFLRKGVGDAYLGNLGAPSVPLEYYSRPRFRDFQMSQPLYAYLYTPESAPYYNVKKPFTQLGYFTAGQRTRAEEVISVIHAQNITPSTAFNITYQTRGTRGVYVNQATRDTDLSCGVSHNGKRYTAYAGYISNTIRMNENGGVVDDWYVTGVKKDQPFDIPMMISGNASTVMRNNTFYTFHSYGIPLRRLTEEDFSMAGVPAVYVGCSVQWDRWTRRYRDDSSSIQQPSATGGTEDNPLPVEPFYEHWYFNSSATRDSLSESRLSSKVFVQLQPWDRDGIVGTVDAGAGVDVHGYYQFAPADFLTGNLKGVRRTSFYVYGGAEGRFRKYFDWNGRLRYVPAGYRQHDLDADAEARLTLFPGKHPVSLSGRFAYSLRDPSYWSETFYSNHYIWNNSFRKENETSLEVRLRAPTVNAEVAFMQSVLGNTVYYGPDKLPVQNTAGAVSVTGIYARKDFRIGGLHLNHRVLLQWSTDQGVAPVPLLSAYLSYFYEFDVMRDVLRIKIGIDGRYNTKYYAFGYDPAIGQFYNQHDKTVGGYPMLDVYVAAKWKRMRILLAFTHLNQDLFGTREYFQILHYPLNPRVFKIGISWGFYD